MDLGFDEGSGSFFCSACGSFALPYGHGHSHEEVRAFYSREDLVFIGPSRAGGDWAGNEVAYSDNQWLCGQCGEENCFVKCEVCGKHFDPLSDIELTPGGGHDGRQQPRDVSADFGGENGSQRPMIHLFPNHGLLHLPFWPCSAV